MRLHVFADEMHAFPHWILANEADGSPIATISQNVENQQQVAHDLANSVNRESDLCDHVRILRGALTTAHAALGRAARYFDELDDQGVVEEVENAAAESTSALEATKERP